MSLGNASRALEIIDTHLVATQSKLKEIESLLAERSDVQEDIDKIVDHLDLIIGDIRAAAGWVTEHECPQGLNKLLEFVNRHRNCKDMIIADTDFMPDVVRLDCEGCNHHTEVRV